MGQQFWKALGRALAHVATSIAVFLLFYFGSKWVGFDQIVAQSIGILAALAPGCYDYLTRNLAGQEIKDTDLIPPEEYSVILDGKTVTRDSSELLNDSDFQFISNLMSIGNDTDGILNLDHSVWKNLSVEDELYSSVLSRLSAEISSQFDESDQISLYAMFLIDLEGRLKESCESSTGVKNEANKVIH